jgi:lysozyme
VADARKIAVSVVGGLTLVGSLVVGGPELVAHLQQLEGSPTVVYADRLAYGVPTVCGGHTDWSMRVGQVYDRAFCDRLDADTATEYGLAVVECIGPENLTQRSLDALTLFAVNVGKAGACGSRAADNFRAGKHDEGCKAISRGPTGKRVWITSGGKQRKGLANRRDFETALCLKPPAAKAVA